MTTEQPPQAVIVKRGRMEVPEVRPLAGGEVAVFSARSPAKETDNEDAAGLIPAAGGRAVIAVADGLGGQRAGAEAAELAIKALVACAIKASPDTDLRTPILDGFERANRSVTALGGGAATTLAALEIDDSRVRPYHVGDSAVMVVGQRGRLRMLTVSHSPVGYAVEAGLLDEREAIHHEDRHLVSNIVGSAEMRIEIGRTLRLNPRDTVLLSSDGLFDNLHTAEIVEIIRKGPLAAAAERLVEKCRRRMEEPQPNHPSHPDDLTFLIYRSSEGARGRSRRPLTTM